VQDAIKREEGPSATTPEDRRREKEAGRGKQRQSQAAGDKVQGEAKDGRWKKSAIKREMCIIYSNI
jgi:hypothetical protein